MDADLLRELELLLVDLTEEDLLTVIAMKERVNDTLVALQFEMMGLWHYQGFKPSSPGLRCRECNGNTWGRVEGAWEVIRCVDVMCGASRRLKVG